MFRNNLLVSSFLIFSVLFSSTSCSKYERLLKSDDYQRKFEVALEYFENEEYVRSTTLIEQILPVYRGTEYAPLLSFNLAMGYYHRGDYLMASHYFDNYVRDFPNSEFSEESSFLRAYCNYLISPRPSLDQTSTYRALDQLRLFMIQYPNSEKIDQAIELIDSMRAKLLEKSYLSARLYYDMGDYRAAIVALKNSLIEFPETRHREEILFMILRSSFLLADNSVPERRLERFESSVDEYYIFIDEFPESSYRREADRFLERALGVLAEYIVEE